MEALGSAVELGEGGISRQWILKEIRRRLEREHRPSADDRRVNNHMAPRSHPTRKPWRWFWKRSKRTTCTSWTAIPLLCRWQGLSLLRWGFPTRSTVCLSTTSMRWKQSRLSCGRSSTRQSGPGRPSQSAMFAPHSRRHLGMIRDRGCRRRAGTRVQLLIYLRQPSTGGGWGTNRRAVVGGVVGKACSMT